MRTSDVIVSTEKAPEAIGAYSQGIVVGGVIYFSGQIGLHPETMELKDSFDEQLSQILNNIDGLLSNCTLTRDDIFKTTIFMTDLSDFPKVNAAYADFFGKPYPARSCVGVSSLPKGAKIEIEVLAKIKS